MPAHLAALPAWLAALASRTPDLLAPFAAASAAASFAASFAAPGNPEDDCP